MSKFDKILEQDLRMVILRALSEQPDYTCNESILNQIAERYGHVKSRDHMKSQLRWLEDVAAIELKDVEGFLIAILTRKGQDHVEGRAIIDDIKRPGPKV